jgi:hypothetical protein
MKKYKNIIFLFFVILSTINSQTVWSSQNALATAYLVVPLSITASVGDLDFGEIILTGSPTSINITPRDGKLFVVTGHPNRNVTFTFNNVTLDNNAWASTSGGNVDNLTFIPSVQLDDGTLLNNGDSKQLILDGNIGKLNVWVGGRIDISATQEVGDYIGQFTLIVNY